ITAILDREPAGRANAARSPREQVRISATTSPGYLPTAVMPGALGQLEQSMARMPVAGGSLGRLRTRGHDADARAALEELGPERVLVAGSCLRSSARDRGIRDAGFSGEVAVRGEVLDGSG